MLQFIVVDLIYQNKATMLTETKYELTQTQIAEQIKFAAKYLELINKELSYKDLINLENVTSYTESYKRHCEIARNGYVYL